MGEWGGRLCRVLWVIVRMQAFTQKDGSCQRTSDKYDMTFILFIVVTLT